MPAPLRPGDPERLGPYRLVERLGQGGMGTVYLGEDGGGRRVAVKVINSELAGDEAFHARFRREVTSGRRVRRFCTATVLDARVEGDPLYVVTEYVDGPALDRMVRERGPMYGGDLEGLAVGIATALAVIHGAGIVHRDLKPANVLLSPTGPRVIDFGIARALDVVDGPTRTGQFVGTPAYVAPELMRGEELTAAADIFAWGCVLAFAGTGRAPFTGSTLPEVIHRITTEPPVLDGLDPAVHGLVSWALSKDPADRPTPARLLRELTGNHDLAVTPVNPARPPPYGNGNGSGGRPPYGGRGRRRRAARWALTLAGLAAAAALGAGLLAALPDDAGPRREPARPARPAGPVDEVFDFRGGPPSPKERVFTDSFDSVNSGWVTEGSVWNRFYRNGEYVFGLGVQDFPTRAAPVDRPPVTQLLGARVQIREPAPDAEAGFYCFGSGLDRYTFLLRGDGRVHIAKDQGPKTDLALGRAPGFVPRRFNQVEAACAATTRGTQLALWVNGRPAIQATDPRPLPPQGRSGLEVNRAGNPRSSQARTAYDDFSLSRI